MTKIKIEAYLFAYRNANITGQNEKKTSK